MPQNSKQQRPYKENHVLKQSAQLTRYLNIENCEGKALRGLEKDRNEEEKGMSRGHTVAQVNVTQVDTQPLPGLQVGAASFGPFTAECAVTVQERDRGRGSCPDIHSGATARVSDSSISAFLHDMYLKKSKDKALDITDQFNCV